MNIYESRKKTTTILGISNQTLYKLAKNNKIETVKINNIQKYNLQKYIQNNIKTMNERKTICYCRVLSNKQKKDLERQINMMKQKYPSYEIISDIGSGLNYNRKGFNQIIDYIINNKLEILVVAYKDRLVRFGFEMIENLIKKYSNGKIEILNKTKNKTPTEEITEDILSIMNIYVAKINGIRKYK